MAVFNITKRAFARERLTVSSIVKTLTASVYDDTASADAVRQKASAVKISVEANALRYTEEGTDPVAATTGTIARADDQLWFDSYEAIKKLKFIRETSDATIEVVYYR
jgi:hypothetical protein